ncbi:MAG TPA: class I SAM-dependent methyltransferase [Solirubrobacterales bacterium]|nr:class I SAM-dependent methyltransferase [Solirubrobacterales bacterium]
MAAGAMGKAYDATWGRAFARFYDRALRATEENGLGAMRGELLAGASGRVIEVGAGTGVNLDLYGDGVEDLTLVEPDPHMGAQLRKRLAERAEDEARAGASIDPADALAAPVKPIPAHLVAAPAETLPFADDTFDTAVATLVLCTIPDPVAAIDELARVLKPGGRLLFIEHVRSDDPGRARWQDRFEKPWRFMADGCHCNRETEANLRSSSFQIESVDHGKLPKSPPIVRPLIRGTAVLAA